MTAAEPELTDPKVTEPKVTEPKITMVTEHERRMIEDFLTLEARLADESRYAEWEALVTDDMHYWIPAGDSAADFDLDAAADRLSFVNDNRNRLATRIRQLTSGKRHAQTPSSPMRRTVSNIEILDTDRGVGTHVVESNMVVYELAVQATHELRIWPARVRHHLRVVDGELRMSAKYIALVTAGEAQPNMTFLF